MVVDEKNDREVYKVGKVFTKEWRKAEVLKLDFLCFFCRAYSSFGLKSLGPLFVLYGWSGTSHITDHILCRGH